MPPSLLDVPQLDGWAGQWDQLVDSSPLPSPFLRSWWLTGAGGPGRHFLLVVDGAHLLGGLPVEKRHQVLGVRMMGDGPLCPDHLDLLAVPGHEAVVLSLLRDWLGRPGERLLDLKGIRAGSRLTEALPGRVRCRADGRGPLRALARQPAGIPGGPALAVPPESPGRRQAPCGRRGDPPGDPGPGAIRKRLDILRELHRSQWGGRSNFLPVFDRFAAGFAGGCAADEVVVHELGGATWSSPP